MKGRAYAAMACVSCAVLIYEIAITRILSVVLWYHFAFLSVSLAMLALGAPGVWFTIRKPTATTLENVLVVGGLALPASTVVLFAGSEHVGRETTAQLLLVIACVLAPLMFLGAAVCLMLMRAEGREIGRMYAADLLGATVGAFLVVPLLRVVPTPHLVAGVGLLPLVGAALVARPLRAGIAGALVLACLLVPGPLVLRVAKSDEPKDLLFTKWTPTARVTIFGIPKMRAFGWGMGSKYEGEPIDQLWIEQDASAGTPITRLEGSPHELGHLLFDVTSAGYQARKPDRVCVIGAGGGRDVLTALASGATDVDAVELNGAVVDALSGPFRAFSGDVYHLPGVHAVVGEGRSFLTRSRGEYDFIQVSLVDTWAATAAGAYALSESYLYTVEALRLYLRKTSPTGVVSISRWIAGDGQFEIARLAQVARAALAAEGITDAPDHVALMSAGRIGTFLISRTPWAAPKLASLDAIAAERGFVRRPTASLMAGDVAAYERDGLDMSPSTDDRPFFFQMVSVLGGAKEGASLSINERSVVLLRKLLVVMAALNVLFFFVPLALKKQKRPPFGQGAYFSCIGIAFMLVELPSAQRFVLYLGHPSFATTVVLTCLLLGAGVGSFVASRASDAAIRMHMMILPVAVVLLDVVVGSLFAATLGQSFAVRVALTAVTLVPIGYLMGVPLPAGMSAFPEEHKPWFWAMNGAASVFAGVMSLALTMQLGFVKATLVGALLYAAAFVQMRRAVPA